MKRRMVHCQLPTAKSQPLTFVQLDRMPEREYNRSTMNIQLLYFDGCSSWEEGLDNLKSALILEGLQATLTLVRVENNAEAGRLKFLGSPSFRIDGVDLWGETRANYSLSCRVYRTEAGLRGAPTVEMLRQELRTF